MGRGQSQVKDRFQDILGARRGVGVKVGQAPVDSDGLVCLPEGEIPYTLGSVLKEKEWYQGGMRQKLNSGVGIFDKQTGSISTGNIVSSTIYGTTVRNGTHAALEYDLNTFNSFTPLSDDAKEFCLKALKFSPIRIYGLFHQRNNSNNPSDRIIHSVIITDDNDRFLKQYTHPKPASRKIVDACAPYLAVHPY